MAEGDQATPLQVATPDVLRLQIWAGDIDTWRERSLVSFHYCQECALAGRMSFGWKYDDTGGYDVTIFDVDGGEPDGKGIVAAPMFEPSWGTLRGRPDAPLPVDAGVRWEALPADFPTKRHDFDERLYPGVIHQPRSKVGGWPTWVQSPAWPPGGKTRWRFAGQLDSRIGSAATWSAGGYAYLFCRRDMAKNWHGELTIQVT